MPRLAAIVALSLLLAGTAWAAPGGTCPVSLGMDASLSAMDGRTRLEFIQKGLGRAAMQARAWHYTWTGINSAIGAGQALAIPFVDDDNRIDRYIALGASAVGLISLWMSPLRAMGDSKRLDARIAGLRPESEDDTCVVLAEAEKFLVRDADSESKPQKWWSHALTIGFGVALGLVTALGFNHYTTGGITAASSMTIGELRLATQPMYSVRLLQRYAAGDLRLPEARRFFWWVSPSIGGAGSPADPRGTHYGVTATVVF